MWIWWHESQFGLAWPHYNPSDTVYKWKQFMGNQRTIVENVHKANCQFLFVNILRHLDELCECSLMDWKFQPYQNFMILNAYIYFLAWKSRCKKDMVLIHENAQHNHLSWKEREPNKSFACVETPIPPMALVSHYTSHDVWSYLYMVRAPS